MKKLLKKFFETIAYLCGKIFSRPNKLTKGNTMFNYPGDFPFTEAKNVIDIVRSGNLMDKKESLAHDAWVVQGYAQSMLIGTPTALAAQATNLKTAEIEPLAALEKVVADAESGTINAQIAIPWAIILKYVIELLLQLLDD